MGCFLFPDSRFCFGFDLVFMVSSVDCFFARIIGSTLGVSGCSSFLFLLFSPSSCLVDLVVRILFVSGLVVLFGLFVCSSILFLLFVFLFVSFLSVLFSVVCGGCGRTCFRGRASGSV